MLDEARALDAADPLALARQRFRLPDGVIYLDGNSLGALPVMTPGALSRTAEREWGNDLITSWNKHGWIDAPARIAAKLAPLVGAKPNELLVADSTSVCLFKLLAAALAARPGRATILTERRNFPTDLYVAQGLADLLPGTQINTVDRADLGTAIVDDTAVLYLTHTDYCSGERHDMRALNEVAHENGALTIWDLSHSAGAFAVELNGSGCDLAVGCGYKYLNGGPGAPAFLFVAEHLQDDLRSPITGWMGHAEPFAFAGDYRPAPGISRFLTGTPSILALAALEAGVGTFDGILMSDIEAKSAAMTQLFIDEIEARCPEVTLVSPRDPAQRGSQVSFSHPDGYAVMQALIARGVIGDFRAPNIIRFGFAPLYNRFEDAWQAADALAEILSTREWDQPRFHARQKVT
ncbi:kynureninase [Sphingomonas alba]|uniref:Kynureninase n=1 Tax=Sphingomonas alba TaxID=2908208 RepID=A0ABT0RP41_9SPHN|nr:kynureninase [Sphingomonas alba]MCL6684370.1 kynureninase [Sphingomonas alba]